MSNSIQLFNNFNYNGVSSLNTPNAAEGVIMKTQSSQQSSFQMFGNQEFIEFQATAFTGTVLLQSLSIMSTISNPIWVDVLEISPPTLTSLFWKQPLQTLSQFDIIRVVLQNNTLATNVNIWIATNLETIQPNALPTIILSTFVS